MRFLCAASGSGRVSLRPCQAFCEQGHAAGLFASCEQEQRLKQARCCESGAGVVTACASCGSVLALPRARRWPGGERREEREGWSVTGVTRPNLCACGAGFPWAGRAERVSELQHLLDVEQLAEATDLRVRGLLNGLARKPARGEGGTRRAQLEQRAPGFTSRPAVARIINDLERSGS